MGAATVPVLMSPENPQGWTLEKLALQLVEEINGKSAKIASDPRPVASLVTANNTHIVEHLLEVAILNGESMAALETIGPDQGPLGVPRIRTR